MTPAKLSEFLTFAIQNHFPVLLKGAPGIGKSDLVEQACKQAGAHLIISHPVVSDPTDYKGLPFSNGTTADFLPFGDLRALLQATTLTVFFLDDLGQAPASVQAAVMQLILARQINGKKVSDFVTFIAATNRKEDKAGVTGLLEPVKSRFASIVELEVSTEDWVKWALDNNMPIELIAFIRFRHDLLHQFDATKDLVNSPSPRTVANVGKLQNAGLDSAIEFEVIKGAAGEGFAVEFTAFLKMFRDLPSLDSILMNPATADIPKEPGNRYALCAGLANRMNENNVDAALTYIDRLPKEFGIVAVKGADQKNKAISKTQGFIKWAAKNHKYF